MRLILQLGGGLLTFLPILWTLDLAPTLGLNLNSEQLFAAMLGLALGPVFLYVQVNQQRAGD